MAVQMNAHLDTTFKKGFLLTEEGLIKLDDIVRKRLANAVANVSVDFQVRRVDGMLLDFDGTSGVISEENSHRNAIKRIVVTSVSDVHKLALAFDAKDGVDLRIEATDRDLAYLLFSDIKEYLNSEVLKFRSFSFDSVLSSRRVFPFFMIVPLIWMIATLRPPDEAEVQAVLASADVHQKLNYLITQRHEADPEHLSYFMGGMFVLMFLMFFVGATLDRIFPRNIFYWGKAAASHDRLLKTREKVIWGVLIAFVIGIASTVAVDIFGAKS